MAKKKYDFKRYAFYDFNRLIGFWLWYIWFRPKFYYVEDDTKDKIKSFRYKNGAVVASCHTSFADPPYIQMSFVFRHHNIIAAKDALENKALKWIVTRLCGILVDRENFSAQEFKYILKTLKDGHIVHFFAEGKINENPDTILEFKDGISLFSFMAKVPIIPMYIKPRKSKWERLKITFGSPIYPSDLDITDKKDIHKLTVYAREKVIEAKEYIDKKGK